jgi:glycosyltransferase involved in cell wall biosynthesis
MNFIYHHRTTGRGGESLHIMHVIEALEAQRHEVEIVSPPGVDPRKTAGAPPLDKVTQANATGVSRVWRWVSCRAPQILFELAELAYNAHAALSVRAALRRNPAATYYERYAFFLWAGVWMARRYGRTVILEVNEVTGLQRARGQLMKPVMSAIERFVFRHSDYILTVSSRLRQEVIARGGDPSRVIVVPNAIDPERFRDVSQAPALRERWQITGKTVVGFVGWFDRWDRLELLIDVAARLAPTRPELRLLLVGDGPIAVDLRNKVRSERLEDVVVFTGAVPRSQVPACIAAMDICVLPDSNQFGSPMVLFEFMGLGRAVIAADVPPVRDVVRHGDNGLVVRPDVDELQSALAMLLDQPDRRRQLGERARAAVLARHTWAATAQRIASLAASPLRQVA